MLYSTKRTGVFFLLVLVFALIIFVCYGFGLCVAHCIGTVNNVVLDVPYLLDNCWIQVVATDADEL